MAENFIGAAHFLPSQQPLAVGEVLGFVIRDTRQDCSLVTRGEQLPPTLYIRDITDFFSGGISGQLT